MPRLVVRLLGGYRVELDGEPVYGFETDKARALLAYLMVEADRPHRRETLASLLWPDRPDVVARNNLRQALFRVRHALANSEPPGTVPPAGGRPPFLFVSLTDVQFNTLSDYALDVAELEALARAPSGTPGLGVQLLPESLCVDFLAGFSIPDSEAFQAWMLNKQEHYHRLTLEILDAQNAAFEAAGDYEKAVAAARLQLELEPWLEEGHRRCMRGLALAGRRDEALRQYEACCRALEAELGVEPAPGTQALHADIVAGRPVTSSALSTDRSLASVAGARPVSADLRADTLPPVRPASRPAALVARADELARLNCFLDAALAGETGVAFVSGDAGSGKTALLEAFAASAMAEHRDLLVAGARCNPGDHLDPLAPLRKLADMLFGDLGNEMVWRLPGQEQVDRLQRATDLALACLAEHGPDLAGTLIAQASIGRRGGRHLRDEPSPPTRTSSPQATLSHGALFDQLACTLAAIARRRPLLLLLDDLHWVDDPSAAFLLHLGRQLRGSRMLLLGAYRSVTVALGRRDLHTGEISRHPMTEVVNELRCAMGEIQVELDRTDGRAFVEAYVDTEPNRLGTRFRDALFAQTGGHALFTVESLRNLQERGVLFKDEAGRWVAHESLDWDSLPARVEAAIAERIGHLPELERRILSAASVQGDGFTGEVVAELIGIPVAAVLALLSGSLARQHRLVRPEGLRRAGSRQLQWVRSFYRFTHHLFRKYLYDELDPVERTQWHAAVAASLDREAGDDPMEREQLSVQLAWHYEAGAMPLQAARALHDAGHQAMRMSASREALARFDHGLALLANVPPSRERTEIQRLLEVARLGPERNLEGIGAAEFVGSLARAAEAWEPEAPARPRLMMLAAQAEQLLAQGNHEAGLAVALRLREEAAALGEEAFVALGHWHAGAILSVTLNPLEAERHLRSVLDWLTPERSVEVRAAIGLDLAAAALAFSALNQWFLGHWEQTLVRNEQALTGAVERGDLYGQAFASALGALALFLLRGQDAAMKERTERCQQLCSQHGFGMWRVYSEVFLGRLMVVRGDDAGIERMRGAIAAWQAAGLAVGMVGLLVVLVDSCLLAATRPDEQDGPVAARDSLLATGLETIEVVLGPGKAASGLAYEPELYRLRGELLLARDGLAAAEDGLACFQKAMELGREKGALAWELRAAMSLVRLRQCQGDAQAGDLAGARACLRGIYGRFSEGLAFPDLQEAAALMP